MAKYRHLIQDTSGALMAEYALMLAIFGMGCGCALFFYGRAISRALDDAADLLTLVSTW